MIQPLVEKCHVSHSTLNQLIQQAQKKQHHQDMFVQHKQKKSSSPEMKLPKQPIYTIPKHPSIMNQTRKRNARSIKSQQHKPQSPDVSLRYHEPLINNNQAQQPQLRITNVSAEYRKQERKRIFQKKKTQKQKKQQQQQRQQQHLISAQGMFNNNNNNNIMITNNTLAPPASNDFESATIYLRPNLQGKSEKLNARPCFKKSRYNYSTCC